jgi:predicted MFS family arabinose efflux permease
MIPLFAPLSSAQFRKYAAATVLSSIGNGMHFVAMSWFLYHRTGAVASIGTMLIITTLPGMFLSPIAGVLLDRWNEKRICVAADTLRGLILSCMVLAIRTDHWVLPAIYVSSFLVATCNLFFQPALSALLRDMSAKEHLLDANVLGSTGQQVGLLCGASLGGVLVAQIGATNTILLNVVSFFISAALTSWIRKNPCKRQANGRKRPGMVRELREAAAYVGQHRFILWLAMVQMFDTVAISVCNTLLPAFVTKELRAGPEAFGFIDSAWGGGAMLGGFLLSYIARRVDRHLISVAGPPCMSALLVFFLSAQSTAHAVAGYFVLGVVVCAVGINTSTVLAADVDPNYFGKVKLSITMFTSYTSLGVYGLLSVVSDHVPTRWIYLTLSAFVMTGSLLKIGQIYRQGYLGSYRPLPATEDGAAGFDARRAR